LSNVIVLGSGATTTPVTGGGTITFGQMKNDICSYFGMDKDPDKVAMAGRAIQFAVDELNRKQQWMFNLIESSAITTVSGQKTIPLPTDFWKIYNARKADSIDYTLNSIRQADFDRLFQGQVNITGMPYVMVVRNTFRDGTVEMFPTPDAVYQVKIRYVKLIARPAADSDFLDLPGAYQEIPYLKAMSRFGILNSAPDKAKYFLDQYNEAYMDMRRSDEDEGEDVLRMTNIEEIAARYGNFLNPSARPRLYDFF
jgi:hypothetical protein